MDPTIETVLTVAGAAVVTTLALQVIKPALGEHAATIMPRFGPLLAVVIAVVFVTVATALTVGLTGATVFQAALTGLAAGMAAVGIYETAKSVTA